MMTDPDGRQHLLTQAYQGEPDRNTNPQQYTLGGGSRSDAWNSLSNWSPITSNNGLNSSLINTMLGLGNGTWSNTGYSFDNASNVSLGYNGSYKSLNTALDGYINIPEIILKGNTNTWGNQIAANFNAYMDGWNEDNITASTDWDRINTGIGGFGFSNGVKTGLIDYAVRTGSNQSGIRAELQVLGKTGTRYLKYAKGLGYIGAGLSTTYSIVNAGSYYYNDGTDWQVGVKAGLDVNMTAVGFLGPIGFGISATYFILDNSTGNFGGFGQIKP